jgi:hypothetical protein
MYTPMLWIYMQTAKVLLGPATNQRLIGIVPRSLREQSLIVNFGQHRRKVRRTANLAWRNDPFAAVCSHTCHFVTLPLSRVGRTDFRSAERRASRRNDQRQHCEEGKHDCACAADSSSDRLVHSRQLNERHPYVRQKASDVHLLELLKIDRVQPPKLQRMQPKAIDRRPNLIRGAP